MGFGSTIGINVPTSIVGSVTQTANGSHVGYVGIPANLGGQYANPIQAHADSNGNIIVDWNSVANSGAIPSWLSPFLQFAQPIYDIGNRLNSGIFWLNVGGIIGGSALSIMAIKILMEKGK